MTDPLSSMSSRIVGERARASGLTGLVADRLPMDVAVSGDHDAWPLISAALLSRATTTLRHIFDLSHNGQSLDSATLGRSLYEHVVRFAWLAADPSAARIEEWRKHDLESRLMADTDCRALGVELFEDEDRAALEAQVAAMTGNRLVLADLAVAADKHWAGKLPGMGEHTTMSSFHGLYAVLYRHTAAPPTRATAASTPSSRKSGPAASASSWRRSPTDGGRLAWPRSSTASACTSPPRLSDGRAKTMSQLCSIGIRCSRRGTQISLELRPKRHWPRPRLVFCHGLRP